MPPRRDKASTDLSTDVQTRLRSHGRLIRLVNVQIFCACVGKDTACRFRFFRRSVRNEQELARFDRALVLESSVLGDSNAVKPRSKRGQTTNYNSTLQSAHNPRHRGTGHNNRAYAGDHEEGGSHEQAPEPAPERA